MNKMFTNWDGFSDGPVQVCELITMFVHNQVVPVVQGITIYVDKYLLCRSDHIPHPLPSLLVEFLRKI